MRGRACSEKLFSLLIFERSDAMLKIRKNQELTMRISSIVYQNKYRIHHEILKDHGFFPRVLSDELPFELRLAPASNVLIGSDKTQLAYELNKISLSMKSFAVKNSLMRPRLTTKIGKRFMCEHVTQDNHSR